jgi:hypothetical protein
MLKYEINGDIISFKYKDVDLKTKFTASTIQALRHFWQGYIEWHKICNETLHMLIKECAYTVDNDHIKQGKMTLEEIWTTYFNQSEKTQIKEVVGELLQNT